MAMEGISTDESEPTNFRLAFYREHVEMARQHETQRSTVSTIIVAIAGGIVSLVSAARFHEHWSIPVILICLGCYGLFFARKQYERNRFHALIAARIRKSVDPGSDPIRKQAEIEHYLRSVHKFDPIEEGEVLRLASISGGTKQARSVASFVARFRLHYLWEGLNIIVALIGVVLLLLTLGQPPEPPTRVEVVNIPPLH
jgi:hypothetical protein